MSSADRNVDCVPMGEARTGATDRGSGRVMDCERDGTLAHLREAKAVVAFRETRAPWRVADELPADPCPARNVLQGGGCIATARPSSSLTMSLWPAGKPPVRAFLWTSIAAGLALPDTALGQVPDAGDVIAGSLATGGSITVAAVIVSAALLIGLFVYLAWLTQQNDWSWHAFAALLGAVLGLIIGGVVVFRVPLAAQYVALGVFLGMGADGLAGLASNRAGATAVGALADGVAAMWARAVSAGAPEAIEGPFRTGAWSAFGTVFLVVLIGFLVPGAT